MLKFKGSAHFRQRIALSCLSGRPIRIDEIRSQDEAPGLRGYEASLLRLTEKISNGCLVEINETGTSLRFRPGRITGGSDLSHDCGRERAVTYFMEVLIILCAFGKKPLDISLRGFTNAPNDVSTDIFRAATLSVFKDCGIGAAVSVKQRAVGPDGAGLVRLSVPIVTRIEAPVKVTDEGMVRRVRGVAWTCRMPPAYAVQALSSAKGVLLQLLADVHIFTDVVSGSESQGYGLALIAETTSGRFIAAERCISGAELLRCRQEQTVPGDVGEQAACLLLDEIKRGGVVDGAHQGLLLTAAALGPQEVNKVRLGALTTHAVSTLRHLKDFLNVQFDVKPDAASSTVFLSCVGFGLKNLARKVQ